MQIKVGGEANHGIELSQDLPVMALFMGLIPIMWSTGAGADVMKRIAAPMIGGLLTSFLLELLIYPVIFYIWKEKEIFNQTQKEIV